MSSNLLREPTSNSLLVTRPRSSKQSDEYLTPNYLFKAIRNRLDIAEFALDAAADDTNTKAAVWYSKDISGLDNEWRTWTWCNPPYSKEGGPLLEWIRKAIREQIKLHYSVLLLPADTSTHWFALATNFASKMLLVQPRVRFIDPLTNKKSGSPKFGSMVLGFGPEKGLMYENLTLSGWRQ